MPKYGLHAFLLEGSWSNEIAPPVIAQAAELGFDFVEIPLLRPAINYTGPLVLEAFAAINPDLIGATCLWHPSKYSPKELATRGLEFLKENAAKAGLA